MAFFAARIVQKQAVAVRNAKGLLLRPSSTLSQTQKDALRCAMKRILMGLVSLLLFDRGLQ
jgi:hypothetical protein